MSPSIILLLIALWLWFILVVVEARHARMALLMPIYLPIALWLSLTSKALNEVLEQWARLFRNIFVLTDGGDQ